MPPCNGESNKATIDQQGAGTLWGLNTGQLVNPAVQYGKSNVLNLSQTGRIIAAGIANVSQIGTGNTGLMRQAGSAQ